MERTFIANLPTDLPVRVCGFADTVRLMKWGAFVVAKDTTGRLQVVVDRAKFPEIADFSLWN